MKFYKVMAKREFAQHGETKIRWFQVGEIKVTPNGGKYLKIYAFPHSEYQVFSEDHEDKQSSLA